MIIHWTNRPLWPSPLQSLPAFKLCKIGNVLIDPVVLHQLNKPRFTHPGQVHRYYHELSALIQQQDAKIPRGGLADVSAHLQTGLHRDAMQQPLAAEFLDAESFAKLVCPAAPKTAATTAILEDLGIPIPAHPIATHQHPANYAIERYMLFRIVERAIGLHESFWMKAGKASELSSNLGVHNIQMSSRDCTRYRKAKGFPAKLKTDTLLLHDVGHYLAAEDYEFLFEKYPNLKFIFVTGIYPHEIRTKEESFYPELYSLRYGDNGLFRYCLEGSETDFYEQDIERTLWLTNRNSFNNHGVERLESLAAHSLHLITRELKPVHNRTDAYTIPAAVVLPQAENTMLSIRDRTVPKKLAEDAVDHAGHLSRFDIGQAIAKLRMENKAHGSWMTPTAKRYLAKYAEQHRDWQRDQPVMWRLRTSLGERCLGWIRSTRKSIRQHPWALGLANAAATVDLWRPKPHFEVLPAQLTGLTRTWTGRVEPNLTKFYTAGWTTRRAAWPSVLLAITLAAVTVAILTETSAEKAFQARERLMARPRRAIEWTLSGWTSEGVSALSKAEYQAPEPAPAETPKEEPATLLHIETNELNVQEETETAPPTAPQSAKEQEPTLEVPRSLTVQESGTASAQEGAPAPTLTSMPDGASINPASDPWLAAASRDNTWTDDHPESDRILSPRSELPPAGGQPGSIPIPNRCGLYLLADCTGDTIEEVWATLHRFFHATHLQEQMNSGGLTAYHLQEVLADRGYRATVHAAKPYEIGLVNGLHVAHIKVNPHHWFNKHEDNYDATTSEEFEQQRGLTDRFSGAKAGVFSGKQLKLDIEHFRFKDSMGNDSYLPATSFERFIPSITRAKAYSSDLKNGHTGMLLKQQPWASQQRALSIDNMMDQAKALLKRRQIYAQTVLGFNGCGKTYPWIQFLRANPSYIHHVKIATPTAVLRSEWIRELGLPPHLAYRVGTFESSALTTKSAPFWIVDEIGKMPPGYLSLGAILDVAIKYCVFLGDVTQTNYHERNPEAQISHLTQSEAMWAKKFCKVYFLWTRRACQAVSRLWDVKSSNPEEGYVNCNLVCPTGPWLELHSAQNDVDLASAAGKRARTINSAQGLTERLPVAISVDHKLIKHTTAAQLCMATNRSKRGIELFGAHDAKEAQNASRNKVLHNFMNGVVQPARLVFARELAGLKVLTELPKTKTEFDASVARGKFYDARDRADTTSIADLQLALRQTIIKRASGNSTRTQKRNLRRRELKLSTAILEKESDVTSKVEETSWYPSIARVHLSHVREEVAREEAAKDEEAREELVRINGGSIDLMTMARLTILAQPTEEREKFIDGRWSNQFIGYGIQSDDLDGIALQTLAMRHDSRKDPTLEPGSIKKRLPKSTPRSNAAEYKDKAFAGRLLFEALHKICGAATNPLPFDPRLFAECKEKVDRVKLTTKKQAFLQNVAEERNDPNFLLNRIKVFWKTQDKQKPDLNALLEFGSMYVWKAGQSIAQLNEGLLYTLGPYVEYMTRHFKDMLPDHIFCLGGQSPGKAARWARRHIKQWVRKFLANDYTAYDQSQGGEALRLEISMMHKLNFPQEIVDLYLFTKLSSFTQFGPSRIMRFTGEAGTYLFNTMFNLALIGLMYNAQGIPLMVSGDDSLIIGTPQVSAIWPRVKHLFRIEAKTQVQLQPEFCGYIYSHRGMIREPKTFGIKLACKQAKGQFWKVAMSYATEAAVGRAMGDYLYELLTPEQIEWHFAMCHHLWDHGGPRVHAVLSTMPELEEEAFVCGKSKLARYTAQLLRSQPTTEKGVPDFMQQRGNGVTTYTKDPTQRKETNMSGIAHTACTYGRVCALNPAVTHKVNARLGRLAGNPVNARQAAQQTTPAAPVQAAPRPPVTQNGRPATEVLRVPITLTSGGTTDPTYTDLNQNTPEIRELYQRFGLLTVARAEVTIFRGFGPAENGSVAVMWGNTDQATRTEAQMAAGATYSYSAGQNGPGPVENFSSPSNRPSRNLDRSTPAAGTMGLRVWHHASGTTASKIIVVNLHLVRRNPRDPTTGTAPPYTAPGAPAQGTGVALSSIAGTTNLAHLIAADGVGLNRTSATPPVFRWRPVHGTGAWTTLTLNGTEQNQSNAPGLSSLFPADELRLPRGLRLTIGLN